MKRRFVILSMLASTVMMTSCFSHKTVSDIEMPIAINTINSVGLKELNLKHGEDYTITNTVSEEAVIVYTTKKKGKLITISEQNGEFQITWKLNEKTGKMYRDDYDGVARFGFLSNDYGHVSTNVISPEYIVRNLATYRLINQAKVRGADGVIEPIISTNAEDNGNSIVFKATVTAKLMKLKADTK